jgi:hypothetical protein
MHLLTYCGFGLWHTAKVACYCTWVCVQNQNYSVKARVSYFIIPLWFHFIPLIVWGNFNIEQFSGKRDDHELICPFIPAFCPNSNDCGQFSKVKLEAHLQTCSHYKCPYRDRGCDFEGYRKSLQEHTAICGYRKLHGISGSFCSEEGSISKEQVPVLNSYTKLSSGCRKVTGQFVPGQKVHRTMVPG